jgi:small ligand-binding sensory domain FIST
MTKVGIGVANVVDARAAGAQVGLDALRSGGLERPDLAIAFCAGSVDAGLFLEGLRATIGPRAPIVGGSAVGVITSQVLSYTGSPAAVALIESDTIRFTVASAGGLDRDEGSVGEALAQALPRGADDRILLAFYDSVRVPASAAGPPFLNSSAPLLAGLEKARGEPFPCVGAGLVGGYDFGPSSAFCGSSVQAQHVVGCLVSGPVTPYVAVTHGCIPLDGIYRRITAMDRDVLYELDGRPIVSILDDLFSGTDWRSQHPVSALTIGVNCGERYEPPREAAYVNRLITGITADGRGVGMFEPDLEIGGEIQFMLRDNQALFASTKASTTELLARIAADAKRPTFALYVDCGGRTASYSLTEKEEAAIVQELLRAQGIPFLGFYSGVEIAPLLGRNRGLDWTGVLLVLAEEP